LFYLLKKQQVTEMEEKTFSVKLKLLENYLFEIDFGEFGKIMTDEPSPLGDSEGPAPSALLAASVANCLAASLLFAVRKHKEDAGDVHATVTGTVSRVEKFWRITKLNVQLHLGVPQKQLQKLSSVLAQFENFCVVTQSVRSGIEVEVDVMDSDGVMVASG